MYLVKSLEWMISQIFVTVSNDKMSKSAAGLWVFQAKSSLYIIRSVKLFVQRQLFHFSIVIFSSIRKVSPGVSGKSFIVFINFGSRDCQWIINTDQYSGQTNKQQVDWNRKLKDFKSFYQQTWVWSNRGKYYAGIWTEEEDAEGISQ